MSEILRPCPFCGSADIRTEPGINLNYCDKCSAEANIEHWNTRPIEDALNARIAELELRLDVYNGNMYDVVVDELDKANARIAELEAERRWIPVSERLPEERQNVLALDRTGTAYHWEYSRSLSNIFVSDYTHWMPLPNPPEVQE